MTENKIAYKQEDVNYLAPQNVDPIVMRNINIH
jgi:hypothetical protein